MAKNLMTNPRHHLYRLALPEMGISSISETRIGFERLGSRHAHSGVVQTFVVFSGRMNLWLAGRDYRLEPGGSIIIASGAVHQVCSRDGSGHVEVIDVRSPTNSPGAFGRFVTERLRQPLARAEAGSVVDAVQRLRTIALTVRGTGVRPDLLGALWNLFAAVWPAPEFTIAGPADDGVDARVTLVESVMCERMSEDLAVAQLADSVHLSRGQLTRLFLQHRGMPPAGRLRELRLQRAKELLEFSSLSVAEVASICGFANPNHFSRLFHDVAGEPPTQFRRRING